MKTNKKALLILILFIFSSFFSNGKVELETREEAEVKNIETQRILYTASNTENSVYLSDIDYIASQSFVGWDKIRYDEINTGAKITLKIENGNFSFKKGIWAHANSQVTYDISKYNYKYFTAFIGLNTTSASGDGVKFFVYTSEDGKNWGTAKYEEIKLPQKEASEVKIELNGAKYLRLVANQLTSNAADHAVWADAKLVNDTSSTNAFKTVEEYNKIIESQYKGESNITGELEFNLLKRELVKNVGQFTLNAFYNESDDNKAAMDFLMSNQKALKYYILGGKPLGNNYYKSLTEYSRLYKNYKNDFNNTEVTKYGTKLGDLYLKMATSLSLTHSTTVGLWMNNASTVENQSDSVRRYAIIRYMHKNNLFQAAGVDYNAWFESYTVEEMRYVMANNIDDQSMLWLNSYVRELIEKEGGARLWPHRYVSYVWPNYANPIYYAEENKDYFNQLFSIRKTDLNSGKEILDADGNSTGRVGLWDVTYTIPGGVDEQEYNLQIPRGTADNKIYKVWMNMRNKFGTGAVCGGISKVGANIRGVLGLPDAVVGQPGHAAHINYFQNSNGEGFWGIDNDVSGWAYTGSSILLGWASGPYASGYTGTYIPLAQEVINHEDTYEQSQKFVYLADSYTNLEKKEQTYRKALEIQPLNLNAWYGLILTYKASENKTEEQYYELAKEIAEALKYYPLPMYQMTNQIKPKLTSLGESYKFTLLQTRILKEASVLPNSSTEVLQPAITRLMGNYLLGQMDTSIATFSFDGEDAGKIVLSSRFDGNGVRWDYAIRGKGENDAWDVSDFKEVSFSAEEEHKLKLTDEEIASITSENDIYIHIVGVNYAEENIYKIDISESAGLPATLFASDLENKLIGAVGAIEWKYNENDEWIRYDVKQPELTGDKTIILRMGATGTYLSSKTSQTFTFTEDDTNNKRKYIPVEHLELHEVSSEAVNNGGSASFAIDANYNTRWHSAWNGSDTNRFITVKLDRPYNVSAVEFVPAGGGNGKIYDGTIYGSMDGENWFVLTQRKNLTYVNQADTLAQINGNIKSFDIEDAPRVQYVKIVADRTNGNWFTARAFNFYEDLTIKNVGTFSFDGAKPGIIELVEEYKDTNWQYSLDGGNTWKNASKGSQQLTKEELESINEENNIKIKLAGDDTEYKINIKKGDTPELGYLNDLENRPIAQPNKDNLEWKIEDGNWISYKDEEPNVTGNRTLYVRTKATGKTTASDAIEYVFTEDNQPDTRKYISVSHLTVHSFISQSRDAKRPHYAVNIIDGNPNTEWHSDFGASIAGKEAFITIKIDDPKYISGIDYLHMPEEKEPYGFMKNGKVYVSEDGENWTEATILENVSKDNQLKQITFDKPVYGQYVKLVIESYDNVFATAAMLNLYEDRSNLPVPTAEIEYSTKEHTNQDVTVKLVNPSTEIKILNNDGKDTYTFTENGEFTFKFKDKNGIEGEATARVDWIIKTLPNVTIEYSTEEPTKDNVTASISFDRDKTRIVDGEGNTIQTLALGEKYIVTFTENGKKDINFVGPYGNSSTIALNVDWIDREAPVGTLTYSTEEPTNKDVVVTLTANEDITITNNGGSAIYTFKDNGTFTFEYEDKAGNKGEATASVTWIDRELAMPTITYSTDKPTNKDVTATITFDKEGVVVEGETSYTFTENGTYEFKYTGPAGNKGVAVAKVNWIDRKVPEATVTYNPVVKTNQPVAAIVTFDEENVTITNNNGSNRYTFNENGTFTFEFADEAGNKGTVEAIVMLIDKVTPTVELEYSTKELTNKDVVVTIVNESEPITITNNVGRKSRTFTENGEFTFNFEDEAGNEAVITAKVDNIDKVLPTAAIEYSTKEHTKENVILTLTPSEEVTIVNKDLEYTKNENGTYSIVIKDNGEYIIKMLDKAGNCGQAIVNIDWIDKTNPTGKIEYSTTKMTNQDVVATLITDEEVTITNNNGKNTYTFTENGTFTFEYEDKAGNKATAIASVNNIDKVVPTAEVEYSTKELTNKDVVVTLINASEEITITNNNGSNKYTFKENGEFTFEFRDKAGNTGTVTAKVENIDKVAPTGEVTYDITEITNKDVTATIKVEDGAEIINNEGKDTYTFKENGKFVFEISDKAGNVSKIEANVTWIDKIAPVGEIKYNINTQTRENVVATLTANEEITITNNEGKNTYTFTENGEFTFEFTDIAGNKGAATAKVNWINKDAPEGKISYSTTEKTDKPVVATLTVDKDVTITNNGGKNTYKFTKNGTFTFEFVDKLGNKGTATARVDWIEENKLEVKVEYDVTTATAGKVVATIKANKPIKVTNNNGLKTYTFTENGEFIFEYEDEEGKKGSITAKVDWIDSSAPTAEVEYSIKEFTNKDVVVKLVNPNRKITITNNNGSDTYTFTKNGEFIFEYVDENGRKGATKAKVNWIDKEVAEVTVVYNITSYTNKDVIATILSNEEIKITNNGGKNTYKFTSNGEFTFEYTDKYGNKGKSKATVEWIDKTAIISTIHYSITTKTNKNVVATLQTNKVVKVINNNGKKTYTFTKNGTFTFEYEDKYGNKGKTTAKVNWIEKVNNTKPSSNTNINSNKPISSNTNSNSNSNKESNSNSNSNSNIESNSNSNSNIEESNSNSNSNIEESNSNSNGVSENNSNSNEVTEKKSSKGFTIATIGLLLIVIGFVAFKFKKRK